MTPRATMPEPPRPGCRYHLIGVAGVGMSALAQSLAFQGSSVSGSDRYHDRGEDLDVLRKLTACGIALVPQDGSGVTEETTAVIYSTAIEDDNPDIARARAQGVPVVHRAEMLAALCEGHACVAVTGTAGKTTVTGMLGWILQQLGREPNVVNGGALVNWRDERCIGNARKGASDLWVIEADESDRSLLRFTPTWSAVTNLSRDHFGLDELERLFTRFMCRTTDVVVCGPSAAGLADHLAAGEGKGPRVVCPAEPPERGDPGWRFTVAGRRYECPLPGRHNAENALIAMALCDVMGCDLDAAGEALCSFRGIERRLECVGHEAGLRVVDEYAHNPVKIDAAWSVAREDADRILAVWRPHGFGPLRLMWDDLVDLFAERCSSGDELFLLPVYYAGGTAVTDVSSQGLADELRQRGAVVHVVSDYQQLETELLPMARAGDTIMVMGARDPDLPRFARACAERLHLPAPPDASETGS